MSYNAYTCFLFTAKPRAAVNVSEERTLCHNINTTPVMARSLSYSNDERCSSPGVTKKVAARGGGVPPEHGGQNEVSTRGRRVGRTQTIDCTSLLKQSEDITRPRRLETGTARQHSHNCPATPSTTPTAAGSGGPRSLSRLLRLEGQGRRAGRAASACLTPPGIKEI